MLYIQKQELKRIATISLWRRLTLADCSYISVRSFYETEARNKTKHRNLGIVTFTQVNQAVKIQFWKMTTLVFAAWPAFAIDPQSSFPDMLFLLLV